MSEEEMIKYIKSLTEITKENNKKGIEVGIEISTDIAEKVLNLIEKQDKMIDEAIKIITLNTVPKEECKNCIKEYFRKKVENES